MNDLFSVLRAMAGVITIFGGFLFLVNPIGGLILGLGIVSFVVLHVWVKDSEFK